MEKINKLTFIKVTEKINNRIYCLYQCECGNTINLRKDSVGKNTTSCGCLQKNKK